MTSIPFLWKSSFPTNHQNKHCICNPNYSNGFFKRRIGARGCLPIARLQGCIWEEKCGCVIKSLALWLFYSITRRSTPPFRPIYNILQIKLVALRKYFDKNLAKFFICHLKSLTRVHILFIKKKNGSLLMCIDYQRPHKITKKNHYPLPLISWHLEELKKYKIFYQNWFKGSP